MSEKDVCIPSQCPPWSIAYCRPVGKDLTTEDSNLNAERVEHNFKLLVNSEPGDNTSDALATERCQEMNPLQCIRGSISMVACRNLIDYLRLRL